ncbi:MAG: alpha-amylase family glycosyl hydrolase [Fusicatenibacter sp.]|nr:alpha-amylase family glycosyl hydrolase [Lachnospiraceae bacterium]MDY2938638.1 alpha-amylase family glycosyl hydrolase [Fusicatenibacter sp.]
MSQRKEKEELQVLAGDPRKLGASKAERGYHFALEIPEGKKAELLLYKKGEKEPFERIPFTEEQRVGSVAAMTVIGLNGNFSYNFCIDGRVCQDPNATALEGRDQFGEPVSEDEHAVRCLIAKKPVMSTQPLFQPYEDLLVYKLHVRGFTKDTSSKVKHKGTFLGVIEKIPYLKELGINAVELMPVYEFFEMPVKKEEKKYAPLLIKAEPKVNYWGYGGRALYYAPKASFSATHHPVQEFAQLVDALHESGIECILEFCFPGEITAARAVDILEYYVVTFHVDGFRIIGDGKLAMETAGNPLLKKTKLIFVGFDGGQIYGESKPGIQNLGEQNQGFQENVRRFLKGDEGTLPGFSYSMRRNPATHGVINYLAEHDGFTMMDMVSYDTRHNEDNGEENRDGTESNFSWNCGAEGPSRKAAVRKLRIRQLKNAFLMLMTGQGTPMIYSGDELGNSQNGNNNAWCQDNKVGWIDWNAGKKYPELQEFVKKAIAFRKEHPAFHGSAEPKLLDYKAYGCPDLSYHSQRAWYSQMENTSRSIGVMYYGDYYRKQDGTPDTSLYIAYNMHWEEKELALPTLPGKQVWQVTVDTDKEECFYGEGKGPKIAGKMVTVAPRSIMILIGKQE